MEGIFQDVVASTIGNSIVEQMAEAPTVQIYGRGDGDIPVGGRFQPGANGAYGMTEEQYSSDAIQSNSANDLHAVGMNLPTGTRFLIQPPDLNGVSFDGIMPAASPDQFNSGVNWTGIVKAGVGVVGSVAGVGTGFILTAAGTALMLAPEPTGVTKIAGFATASVGVAN